jgi:exopolysaccharide biosynthesis polyprenyl glycosylphosphotransferase
MTTVSDALLTADAAQAEELWVGSSPDAALTPWQRTYGRVLFAADVVAVVAAGLMLVATGLVAGEALVFAVAGPIAVVAFAAITPDRRSLPTLVDDLRAVGRVVLGLTAVGGFLALLTEAESLRDPVVHGLPVLAVLAVAARLAVHASLRAARAKGQCLSRVVVVGSEEEVLDLIGRIRRDSSPGFKPVAACVPGAGNRLSLVRHQVPVAGDVWQAVTAAERFRADAVLVGSGTGIDATVVRRLAWQLESSRARLVVAPPLTETYRGRLAVRSLAAAPVIHVAHRTDHGVSRDVKAVVERTLATGALLLLAPVLLGIGLAIRLSSAGPAFYRQTRVGRGGREFTLLKFRTMVSDADALVYELGHLNVRSEGLLFKIPKDPRVTRVGAWLRRTSLDELPQLVHVVTGKMSLVGPRPPLPREVARYTEDERRRLLVKPGLTGLWQVSGRSDLTWEESVRLDLRYVENWSLGLDLAILARTWSAVIRGRGAY